ncbi:MAG: hypothetical protein JOZ78_14770 [Chroococcidiopsidaceae cyanobacterium CP_BM_ER_R8_30]|nr:hypothetical protein [Chroococcidiopsidaceae cyanobacterium CP_BM_ER_R8_30]
MTPANPTQLSNRQAEKLIKQNAKKVISAGGIDPSTRKGNKEFNHLVKKISQQFVGTSTHAAKLGEDLGQKIVALSQKLGRKSLDRGVIQQLIFQKDIPSFAEIPKEAFVSRAVQPLEGQISDTTVSTDALTQPPQTLQIETQASEESGSIAEASAEEATSEVAETSEEIISADTSDLIEPEEEIVSADISEPVKTE